MARHKILVMDSGVGGLSVLKEIQVKLPGLNIDYLADHAYFPYGPKTPDQLMHRVSLLVETLCAQQRSIHECYTLVVIACNSASTAVLDHLRSKFDLPFVGVVPAIKPACSQSSSKCIGLLATEGTIQRDYTHALIRAFGADHQVTLVGSSELVAMAEAKLADQPVSQSKLRSIIAPFKAASVDTIVLGCTHFPLLKAELDVVADWPVRWVDSGEAIANRVASLLGDFQSEASEEGKGVLRFLSTAMPDLSDSGWIKQTFTHIEPLSV